MKMQTGQVAEKKLRSGGEGKKELRQNTNVLRENFTLSPLPRTGGCKGTREGTETLV